MIETFAWLRADRIWLFPIEGYTCTTRALVTASSEETLVADTQEWMDEGRNTGAASGQNCIIS